jgi:hypothetical protein
MVVVSDPADPVISHTTSDGRVLYPSGLTPPTRDIRPRHFDRYSHTHIHTHTHTHKHTHTYTHTHTQVPPPEPEGSPGDGEHSRGGVGEQE